MKCRSWKKIVLELNTKHAILVFSGLCVFALLLNACSQVERTVSVISMLMSHDSDTTIHMSSTLHKTTRAKSEMIPAMSSTWKEQNNSIYDIMNMPPIKFSNLYKNPCWNGSKHNGPVNDGRIHCLPYFYILGIKKSGTSDLYKRISMHPDFIESGVKELQWLPRVRFGEKVENEKLKAIIESIDLNQADVGFYVSMFEQVTLQIISKPINESDAPFLRKITGDATPANFHIHTKWPMLPGNEGLTEPKYTNFHYLKHLTPDTKIIMIFRDPVSRMFSDFRHTLGRTDVYDKSASLPEIFHHEAVVLTKKYQECFSLHSFRRCIYNHTIQSELEQDGIILYRSFTAGIYEVYMRDILAVFGEDELLPIFTNEYSTNMKTTLSQVFDFLGLDQPNKQLWKYILKRRVSQSKKLKTNEMMFNKTKHLLDEFFKPHNNRMAQLMNDNRYNFDEAKI